ncbi:hypothetical protein HDE_02369 [Halotydeus destructor]|nr:hypothetical protein HDE_02369 [Halotydeus destructor]
MPSSKGATAKSSKESFTLGVESLSHSIKQLIDKQSNSDKSSRKFRNELERQLHNGMERKRKDKINAWIMKINELLPDQDPKKESKSYILERTYDHLKYLGDNHERLLNGQIDAAHAQEIARLNRRIQDLEKKNRNYCSLLEKSGISPQSVPDSLELWKQRPTKYSNKMSKERLNEVLNAAHINSQSNSGTDDEEEIQVVAKKQKRIECKISPKKTKLRKTNCNDSSTQVITIQNSNSVPQVVYVKNNDQPNQFQMQPQITPQYQILSPGFNTGQIIMNPQLIAQQPQTAILLPNGQIVFSQPQQPSVMYPQNGIVLANSATVQGLKKEEPRVVYLAKEKKLKKSSKNDTKIKAPPQKEISAVRAQSLKTKNQRQLYMKRIAKKSLAKAKFTATISSHRETLNAREASVEPAGKEGDILAKATESIFPAKDADPAEDSSKKKHQMNSEQTDVVIDSDNSNPNRSQLQQRTSIGKRFPDESYQVDLNFNFDEMRKQDENMQIEEGHSEQDNEMSLILTTLSEDTNEISSEQIVRSNISNFLNMSTAEQISELLHKAASNLPINQSNDPALTSSSSAQSGTDCRNGGNYTAVAVNNSVPSDTESAYRQSTDTRENGVYYAEQFESQQTNKQQVDVYKNQTPTEDARSLPRRTSAHSPAYAEHGDSVAKQNENEDVNYHGNQVLRPPKNVAPRTRQTSSADKSPQSEQVHLQSAHAVSIPLPSQDYYRETDQSRTQPWRPPVPHQQSMTNNAIGHGTQEPPSEDTRVPHVRPDVAPGDNTIRTSQNQNHSQNFSTYSAESLIRQPVEVPVSGACTNFNPPTFPGHPSCPAQYNTLQFPIPPPPFLNSSPQAEATRPHQAARPNSYSAKSLINNAQPAGAASFPLFFPLPKEQQQQLHTGNLISSSDQRNATNPTLIANSQLPTSGNQSKESSVSDSNQGSSNRIGSSFNHMTNNGSEQSTQSCHQSYVETPPQSRAKPGNTRTRQNSKSTRSNSHAVQNANNMHGTAPQPQNTVGSMPPTYYHGQHGPHIQPWRPPSPHHSQGGSSQNNQNRTASHQVSNANASQAATSSQSYTFVDISNRHQSFESSHVIHPPPPPPAPGFNANPLPTPPCPQYNFAVPPLPSNQHVPERSRSTSRSSASTSYYTKSFFNSQRSNPSFPPLIFPPLSKDQDNLFHSNNSRSASEQPAQIFSFSQMSMNFETGSSCPISNQSKEKSTPPSWNSK